MRERMEGDYAMNIFHISDLKKGMPLYETLLELFSANLVVPIIGSGFTRDHKAAYGKVPSVKDLCSYLVRLIDRCFDSLSIEDLKHLNKLSEEGELAQLASMLLDNLNDLSFQKRNQVQSQLMTYMKNNFTGVRDLSTQQKRFLSCPWPYLYTLNYDDAIETYLNEARGLGVKVALPYENVNKDWQVENNIRYLIKIHGDAWKFTQGGDFNYLILTDRQYMDLIEDQRNKLIVDGLKEDFSSKAILFVGCGLNNELDLLFANSRNLTQLCSNGRNHTYYVLVSNKDKDDLTLSERSKLNRYNINNVVIISREDINRFYTIISKLAQEANEIRSDDVLSDHAGFAFNDLPSSARENIHLLYTNEGLINYKNKVVTRPYFAINRDIEKGIIEGLKSNVSIHALVGDRFSGKTYVLLNILHAYKFDTRKAYFFSGSRISTDYFPKLFTRTNCLYIFDSGTLQLRQLKSIVDKHIDKIISNRIKILVSVDTSDGDFIRKIAEFKYNGVRQFNHYLLSKKLSCEELSSFNSKMGELLLANRNQDETFLDYLIRIDDTRLHTSKLPLFNSVSLNNDSSNTLGILKAIITLAINPDFESRVARILDLLSPLDWLCSFTHGVVQISYLPYLQRTRASHSGILYSVNSTYWIRRYLYEFAKEVDNYDLIADAFESIIECFKFERDSSVSSDRDYEFYNSIGLFINLDTIQEIFFLGRKGSLVLPKLVFDRLAPILNEDYQFLHQYSKCLLRLARHENKNTGKRFDLLSRSKDCIVRAISLADSSFGENKGYTVAHMQVTNSLITASIIKTSYDFDLDISSDDLRKAINIFYSLNQDYSGFLTDYMSNDDLGNRESDWFYAYLGSRPEPLRKLIEYDPSISPIVENLLNSKLPGSVKFT